jgi:uncharacterized membrane protein (UPF0136 family)
MGWLNVVLVLYGLLCIAMGLLGYLDKSLISLIAGGTCGIVVLASVVLYKFKPRAARITALVIAVLLIGKFAPATFAKNEFYPSGLMFATSLAVAVCLLAGHVLGMKAKKARQEPADK